MLPELLRCVSLFTVLHRIDRDLAEQTRQTGCPYCQGPLHNAPYLRKPRGGPPHMPEEYQLRLSLCCGRRDCRRRVLPPSCLFMERRVYWQLTILVVMTLHQGRSTGYSINRLMRTFAVPRKTIVRWIGYFRDEFAKTHLWRRLRGRVSSVVSDQVLPGGLVCHFLDHHDSADQAMIACLRFLASG